MKERKEPRILGPGDKSISCRNEGTTVQVCGDSNVAENWINDVVPWVKNTKGRLGTIRRRCTRGGKKKWRIPSPRSTIM